MCRVGQPVDPGGVREILGFESDHVRAGDPEALAVDVDEADLRPAACWLHEIVEWDGHEAAALDADHGTAAAGNQEAYGAVTEVTAILRVVGNRVRASKLVPD